MNKETEARVLETLYGNGKDGLTTEVKMLMEDRRERKWMHRAVFMCVLALLAKDIVYPAIRAIANSIGGMP